MLYAQDALNAYNEARGEEDTLETDTIDLITDLLLQAHNHDLCAEHILEVAQLHFEGECSAEQDNS